MCSHLRSTDLLTQNAFKRMVTHRYDVMKYIVFPATKEKSCSYVELVAPEGTTAQTPMWFVSHWSGRRVFSPTRNRSDPLASYELGGESLLFRASTAFDGRCGFVSHWSGRRVCFSDSESVRSIF